MKKSQEQLKKQMLENLDAWAPWFEAYLKGKPWTKEQQLAVLTRAVAFSQIAMTIESLDVRLSERPGPMKDMVMYTLNKLKDLINSDAKDLATLLETCDSVKGVIDEAASIERMLDIGERGKGDIGNN